MPAVLTRPTAIQKPPPGVQMDRSDPVNRGLVAFWPLNEGGGTQIRDTWSGLTAKTGATSTAKWVGGAYGPALKFAGDADAQRFIGSGLHFPASSPASYMWANLQTVDSTLFYFAVGDAQTADTVWHIENNFEQGIRWNQWSDDQLIDGGAGNKHLGVLNISIATQGADKIVRVYRNGFLIGSSTAYTGFLSPNQNFYIGGHEATGNPLLTGRLDVMAWWARTLTARDIQRLSADPFCGFLPTTPLRRWWFLFTPVSALVWTGTDSGTVSDSATATGALAASESGTASITQTVSTAMPGADSGAETDSSAIAGGIAGAESGSLIDSAAAAGGTSGSDNGSGSEGGVVATTVAGIDASSLTDSSATGTGFSGSDSGSGSEGGTLATAAIGVEAALLSDAAQTAGGLAAAESAALTEAGASAAGLSSIESGSVTDSATADAGISGLDNGLSFESAVAAGALTGSEVLVGAELSSASTSLAASDSGTMTDSSTHDNPGSGSDSGAMGEGGTISTGASGSEAGSQVEGSTLDASLAGSDAGTETASGAMSSSIPWTGVDALGMSETGQVVSGLFAADSAAANEAAIIDSDLTAIDSLTFTQITALSTLLIGNDTLTVTTTATYVTILPAPFLVFPLTLEEDTSTLTLEEDASTLTIEEDTGELTLELEVDTGMITRKVGSIWEHLRVRAHQADGTILPNAGLTTVLVSILSGQFNTDVVTDDPATLGVDGWVDYDWGTWALREVGSFLVTVKYPYSSGSEPAIAPSRGYVQLEVQAV